MTAITTVRHFLSLPLGFLSALVLAWLYAPGDIGRFGILAFAVSLPAMAGDLGLTHAFIRQKEDPEERQLALAASLHLWIAAAGFPLILLGVGAVARTDAGGWLTLAAVLYLPTLAGGVALRANVLVARRLDFARLAVLDIIQQILYVMLLATFGALHAGVTGLVVASSAMQLFRLLVLVIWYPLRPAGLPRVGALRSIVRSGLPLHLTSVANGLHANMLNWLGVPLFGPVAAGLLRWSQEITNRIGAGLAQAVAKIVFPTLALLQSDFSRVQRVLGRACRYNTLLVGVPLVLVAGLATPIISAVFGERWLPASPAIQLFALLMVVAALIAPLDAAVKIIRPTTWSLWLALVYLAVEVGLALGFAPALGFLAIPVAHLAASIPLVAVLWRLLPGEARPPWTENVFLPLLALGAAFGASYSLGAVLQPWPAIMLGGATGAGVAALTIAIVGRGTVWPELLSDLRRFLPSANKA